MTPLSAGSLVLRKIPYQDAHLIVTWLTDSFGVISTLARHARSSSKRFDAIEPVHTYRVSYREGKGGLAALIEARLLTVRLRLTSDLEALDAAGFVFRWARALLPAKTPEPEVFALIVKFLDDVEGGHVDGKTCAVRTGIRLLELSGYGLSLDACVKCARARPSGRDAYVSPEAGGVVCRACGGGRKVLDDGVLSALRLADEAPLSPDYVRAGLHLIDETVNAHASGGTGGTSGGTR